MIALGIMEPLISTGLAKNWLSILLSKWTKIRTKRKNELSSIRNIFGDPELLAKCYVEPDCQLVNPADLHEEEPIPTWSFKVPIREWINSFLRGDMLSRDGRNTLFILSDAGIGKSSLLMMLKLTELARFWPRRLKFILLKLGPSTISDITTIKDRRDVVLLLDALDEDPDAFERVEARISEILQEASSFYRLIITCRTQFFPEGGEAPVEQPGKIEVSGFICNLVYLSPFSDEQVNEYLEKIYPYRLHERLPRWWKSKENKRIRKAKEILSPMKSLKMRPMLLVYIDDLVKFGLRDWREYAVYEALLSHWLLREERKGFRRKGPKKEDLWKACELVALALQRKARQELAVEDLEELLRDHPVARYINTIDIGGRSLLNRKSSGEYRFSHYSIQEFLVANAIVNDEEIRSDKKIRRTDQVVSFIYSWVAEDPKNRWMKVWSFIGKNQMHLIGVDYREVDFRGAENIKALLQSIKDKNFEGSKFTGADLSHVDFTSAKMMRSDFRNANIEETNFWQCLLIQADLEGCYANGSNFENANLIKANLKNSKLTSANFNYATLKKADLTGADLTDATFFSTDLRGAILMDTVGLKQIQLTKTYGDETTTIPLNLIRPKSWITQHP